MNILLADDEPRYRDLMAIFFEKWPEHRLTTVANGLEAWILLSDPEKRFDVVFLDIHMPAMTGLDVLKLLAESDRHRSVEVVMCTSRNDKGIITHSLELGARHYIVKPWTEAVIAHKLERIAAIRNTRLK
jgi:two-component system, chemotaxis family, chemotaxis protein CheY